MLLFLIFLINYFIFSICNFECIMTSILFIIFAFSLLMFFDMTLIFISCIIISNFSQRRVAVITTFLIQKSFNFNIFLLFSEITLNIINFLNFCIFIIFSRTVSLIATSDSCVNVYYFFRAHLLYSFYFLNFFYSCHQFHFSAEFSLR